jgi:hypothetical protein
MRLKTSSRRERPAVSRSMHVHHTAAQSAPAEQVGRSRWSVWSHGRAARKLRLTGSPCELAVKLPFTARSQLDRNLLTYVPYGSAVSPVCTLEPVKSDSILGRAVEIRSVAGIVYSGIVKSVRPDEELGELFELSSERSAEYRRLVYVADRLAQIRDLEDVEEAS